MTHEHGSEYQVRIVHEDETEELSGWMNGQRRSPKRSLGAVGRQPKLTGCRYETFSVSNACIEK